VLVEEELDGVAALVLVASVVGVALEVVVELDEDGGGFGDVVVVVAVELGAAALVVVLAVPGWHCE